MCGLLPCALRIVLRGGIGLRGVSSVLCGALLRAVRLCAVGLRGVSSVLCRSLLCAVSAVILRAIGLLCAVLHVLPVVVGLLCAVGGVCLLGRFRRLGRGAFLALPDDAALAANG